jgi:hypothetical protein
MEGIEMYNGPQCGFDVVIVYSDGTHRFVSASESILWYDWNGEYHYI